MTMIVRSISAVCLAVVCAGPAGLLSAQTVQRPQTLNAYVAAGPGSKSRLLGMATLELEVPVSPTLSATGSAGAVVVVETCDDCGERLGGIAELGVDRVASEGRARFLVGLSAGISRMDRVAPTFAGRVGFQLGSSSNLRLGLQLRMLPGEDFIAFPLFVGLRIPFGNRPAQ